jgi:hypothetical protein
VPGDGGTGNSGTGGTDVGGGGTSGSTGGANDGGATTSGTAEGGAGAGNGGAGNGGTGNGGAGNGGAGGANADPCDSAQDGQPCDVEGLRCGGECTDPCVFCNISLCNQGSRQQLEAFPAPCFDCGMELSCQENEAVCQIENGAIYSEECVTVPAACDETLDCACLEVEVPGFTCTELGPGSFVVERSD